ncbi:MAG: BlaI/MecI/CopY family transcriptional regulator [Pirellulales bacterium]
MARKTQTLGRSELELLQYINAHHPITVRELVDYWQAHTGQARTTVLKMVERLMAKGFLSRQKVDAVYQYSPRRPTGNAVTSLVADFVRNMLGGSVSPFVAYLSESGQLSEDELTELKKIVDSLQPTPPAKDRGGRKS